LDVIVQKPSSIDALIAVEDVAEAVLRRLLIFTEDADL
jgi:hypothetical protein